MSRPRAKRLRDHILAADADVWVLTETHPYIDLGPRYRIAASSTSAPDRTGAERWVSIWVRAGFTTTSYPDTDTERTTYARLSSGSAVDWYVYGVVLPWHGDKRRDPKNGSAAFMDALKELESDWDKIQDTYPKARLLVAGDFNQDLLDKGHYYGSRARREALRDTLESAGLKCVTGGSADPVARQIAGHASVDHICIPEDSRITVTDVEVWPSTEPLKRGLSDHYGVLISLHVAEPL